jgi:hypothetical protein
MAPRYSICVVIGGSLLVAYAARKFKPAALNAALLCAIFAFILLGTWHLRYGTDAGQTVSKRHFLRPFLDGRTPVVIANGLTFAQLDYYSPPEIRHRLYYLADPVLGRRYLHTDSVDLRMPVLGRYLALQVENDQDFFSAHHDFLLYSDGQWNWLGPYLLDLGASVQLIGQNGDAALYKVDLPGSHASLKGAAGIRGERSTPSLLGN